MSDSYPISRRNKVVRRPQRGHYDKATVHAILDGALLAHIAYVMDGQPFCTPTAFWREAEQLYWHGSSARVPRHGRVHRSLLSGPVDPATGAQCQGIQGDHLRDPGAVIPPELPPVSARTTAG